MTDTTGADLELLVVPHTHWDREWYLTFQQFRMKLVDTVDAVLETLESDAAFSFFMLDGQTIVLEDYLEIRPENATRVETLARQGRLLLGPWYLQPDEFLVGGESLIRNLQVGRRMGRSYGGVMPIGYVPDTFGHIAQLPQLLRGFQIDNAVFWRGVGPEVKKDAFHWRAPDGSEVLVAWLNDEFGYSNAAQLPLDAEALAARVELIARRMRSRASTTTLLLMNGSDHLMPQTGLPSVLEAANKRLRDQHLHLRIGTLPEYIDVLKEVASSLQTQSGEMRSSYAAHLLPGVYSSRMWLKQRNAAGEAVLTRWTEPATVWSWLLGESYPQSQVELAWKFLMQNHPHDSICGCSIDQVHAEMMSRFAQSEQIASELTTRALRSLASNVRVNSGSEAYLPVVVFNVSTGPRTEVVRCTAPIGFSRFEVVDELGIPASTQVLARQGSELLNQVADKTLVLSMLGIISAGRVLGYTILDARIGRVEADGTVPVEVDVAEKGAPNLPAVERLLAEVQALAEDEKVTTFHIIAREAPITQFLFLAAGVPAFGGRSFTLQQPSSSSSAVQLAGAELQSGPTWLENSYLRLDIDPASGCMSLLDKVNDQLYEGLNHFVDGGDVGDLYNFCPPAEDRLVDTPAAPPRLEVVERGLLRATLRVRQTFRLPASCSPDRVTRSGQEVNCDIVTDVSLDAGSRRLDFVSSVENTARDHRLRVLFPVPFLCETADAEGTFGVFSRPATQAEPAVGERQWSEWAESPVNTYAQRRFVDLHDGERGLAVLNRGLPEYEIVDSGRGTGGSALALTLLRCTEWLSRDDLRTRRGHAGPPLYTPEAQGMGRRTFEYALVPHSGTWESEAAFVLREAQAYEAPCRAVVTDPHPDGALPSTWSFLRVEPASIAVSAMTRSASGDGLIVRLFNPLAEDIAAELTLAMPIETVERVNLAEEPVGEETSTPLARILSTGVRTSLRGGEIQTLRFSLASQNFSR